MTKHVVVHLIQKKKKSLKSGLELETPVEPVKERVTPSGSACIQFSLGLALFTRDFMPTRAHSGKGCCVN